MALINIDINVAISKNQRCKAREESAAINSGHGAPSESATTTAPLRRSGSDLILLRNLIMNPMSNRVVIIVSPNGPFNYSNQIS